MNLEEVKKMSNDELRIKIAGLYGYTEVEFITVEATTGYNPTVRVCLGVINENAVYKDSVPNYPEDLNAMYKAERKLLITANLQEIYIRNLKNLSFDVWTKADGWATFGNARQRAEAFVLTLS